MIALLFLLLSVSAHVGVIQRIWQNSSLAFSIAFSLLLSIITTSWLGLMLVWLSGYTVGLSILIAVNALALLIFRPRIPAFLKIKPSLSAVLFTVLGSIFFFVLFSRAFFPQTNDGWGTVLYTYGDLALHSTYSNYFAQQDHLSLRSPLYSQEPITYPFLINFYTAVLIKLGLSIRAALMVSSLQVSTVLLLSLYWLSYGITQKASTAAFAFLLFFFNGGVKGLQFFADWRESGKSIGSFLLQLPKDYAHDMQQGYVWSNIVTTHLLPQRGFLLGASFFLWFLWAWQSIWYHKKIKLGQLLVLSTVLGAVPLFHTHTYLVATPLFTWFCTLAWRSKKVSLQTSLLALLPAVVLGVTQLLILSPDTAFISLKLGWLSTDNIITFWWQNMGVWLLLLIAGPILFAHRFKKRTFEKALIIPSLGIFLICNVLVFQPYEWDNMKFFMLSHAVMAVLLAAVLSSFWNNSANKIYTSLVLLFCCWSGVLSVLYIATHPVTLATKYDLHLAQFVRNTPADAIFLITDDHNHPVPMLAGRAVVLGYRAWLMTHGVDYTQTAIDLDLLYQGIEAPRLLKKYDIDYVVIGPRERRGKVVDVQYFKQHFPAIYEDGITTIYRTDSK